MNKRAKGECAVAAVIVCLTIALAFGSGSLWEKMEQKENTDTVYVLYIGLNDRETYEQEISMEDAYRIVNDICLDYADGYTISEARGAWKDETGTITWENTLVCSLQEIEEDAVEAIMNEILPALHQNSILLEKRQTSSSYYYGTGSEGDRYEPDRK